jgi:hypothetical protein
VRWAAAGALRPPDGRLALLQGGVLPTASKQAQEGFVGQVESESEIEIEVEIEVEIGVEIEVCERRAV